jgi:RHS repeat-associated protein
VARYEDTQNLDEPLALLRSGTTSYYEADGLGSVTSLTTAAGALAQTYTFDSFGNLTASSGSLTNPFRYTGREFDTETNLYFYRHRYYDQTAGRFLSEDPIGFGGGNDFYRYVANNPVKRRDPFGLRQLTFGGGAGIGVLITFGYNSGQFNAGVYWGVGEGLFANYDPTDSGCHSQGIHGGVRGDAGIGPPTGDYGGVSDEISVDGSGNVDFDLNVNVNLPPAGGITWNPTKPHEKPHGVLGLGAGGFGGLGATAYSSGCGCKSD